MDIDLEPLAAQFRRFADADGRDDPLYVALATAIAAEPELLALLTHAAAGQRKPVLLLAALHDRILAGGAAGHPLAGWYASVGGTRAPDAELPALLLDFARAERAALIATLATRTTQTNEIGRCAVLWPALQALAARSGRQDLALFDFGCSAGLNLGVDRYRYRYRYGYGGEVRGAAAVDGVPTIRCEQRGTVPLPPDLRPRLVARAGADIAPVDLADAARRRWLRACLWPGDAERARRLEQAIARRGDWPLIRTAAGLDALEAWLGALPAGAQPVLFNSWVLAYFDHAARAAHRARVHALIERRGLAWISAEASAAAPLGATPPVPEGESPGSATLWTLQWRGATGAVESAALAWSHPHGRWVEWLDARSYC